MDIAQSTGLSRTIAALFAVCCCLWMSGCSDSDDDVIEIRWWDGPTMLGLPGKPQEPTDTAKDYHLKLAREFEKLHPEARIEVSIYGWWEIRNKIKIALMAGQGPDIGYDEGDVLLNYARIGALEPVDAYLTVADREDYLPEVLARATYRDHVWYFPFDSSSPCFVCVNRRIFRDRNAEHLLLAGDGEPWTLEEFVTAAQAVTFDRDGDGLIDVWGLGLQFKEEHGYGRNAVMWGMGARIFNDQGNAFMLNSPEAEGGLQFLYDLEHKHKVLKPGSTALGSTDLQDAWLRGKIAMIPALATIEEGIEQGLEDGIIQPSDVEIDALPFPRAAGKAAALYLVDDGVCVFKQDDERKEKLVMEFARFITNAEHQRERSPYVRMFPVRRSAGDVYENNAWMRKVDALRQYAATDPSCAMYIPMRRVLLPMYQSVMIGDATPAEALAEAEKRAARILEKESLQ